jgi:glucosamine kinase
VGGTQTRWALADSSGAPLAADSADGWSALMLHDEAGRSAIAAVLAGIARAAAAQGRVAAVVAGVTGFDAQQLPALAAQLGAAFGLAPAAVRTLSDIELACHAAFAPGEGYVLYAGTGSVAAFIDAQGELQRAGGRGAVIDDAGGGHWIAREALRAVWRAEDEAPGAWRQSTLAQCLFDTIGGSDWARTRAWVYGASRGELGTLALAVAAAAEQGDAVAAAILDAAGAELARLALALWRRHGARPVLLAGRVFELHPRIAAAVAAAIGAGLPPDQIAALPLQQRPLHPQIAAARLAAATLIAESPCA